MVTAVCSEYVAKYVQVIDITSRDPVGASTAPKLKADRDPTRLQVICHAAISRQPPDPQQQNLQIAKWLH
jgi:hypothetical protein